MLAGVNNRLADIFVGAEGPDHGGGLHEVRARAHHMENMHRA
jgi:hypothetical protein